MTPLDRDGDMEPFGNGGSSYGCLKFWVGCSSTNPSRITTTGERILDNPQMTMAHKCKRVDGGGVSGPVVYPAPVTPPG